MAMRVWTQQELVDLEAKIQRLHASQDLYDNVLAVLLDNTIGGARMHDEHASQKAKAIVALMIKAKNPPPVKKAKAAKKGK